MEKQSFPQRVLFPLLLVLAVMIISTNAYDYSRRMENRWLIAHMSAAFMFLSIWMGALFANTLSFFRGAGFGERLFVSLFTPVVWSAKILYSFHGIFSFGEFLFLLVHNLILGCPVVGLLCMGLSEIWCRLIYRRRYGRSSMPLFSPGSFLVFFIGVALTFLMLWNGGHSYYYLYMDVYSRLFL